MEFNKEDQDQVSLEVDYSQLTSAMKQAESKLQKKKLENQIAKQFQYS